MTNKLKEMIIKRAVDQSKGMDIDGDVIKIFDKIYLVDCVNGRLEEIKWCLKNMIVLD